MTPTVKRLLLSLTLTLLAPAASPAQSTTFWATAQGNKPASFLDHGAAHDADLGPNGTWAVGRWTGPVRMGSFTGFHAAVGEASISRVEVLLHLYVTGPVVFNRLSLTLDVDGTSLGPLSIAQDSLNQHVGAGAAGLVSANFSLLRDFTPADLALPITVNIMCKRQGPDDGAEVRLDAVGLRVTQPGFHAGSPGLESLFDLHLAGAASSLADSAPLLTHVTSPVTVSPSSCPEPVCFLQVRDGLGGPQPVAVGLMPDGGTVRVGFDDGMWAAPVDAFTSTVTVPAEGVSADGVSRARVRIVVRDAASWPLGGMLAMQLDPALLDGTEVDGDIVDLGDGAYDLYLISLSPATAVIALTVEGVPLADSPSVVFN